MHKAREGTLQPRTEYSSARLRGGSGRYSASMVYGILNQAYMNGAADPLTMVSFLLFTVIFTRIVLTI